MPSNKFLFRRAEADAAIAAVLAGARAEDLETETLDFKEEHGTFDERTRRRQPIAARDQRAAAVIAGEAACFANSPNGGTLVVGVGDKLAGLQAFTGSYLDLEWLRSRVWDLTTPHLSLSDFEERVVAGARIYLVDVPDNLGETYVDGKVRVRHGARCIEPSVTQARELLELRRGFDWTAEPSGLRFADAEPAALESARRHYAEAHGDAPESRLEIARRLGVVAGGDPADPDLNRAGALLLAPFESGIEQLVLLVTDAEGVPSRRSVRGAAPLLPLFDAALDLLREHAFPSTPAIVGSQRRAVRTVPEGAFREALVNALMHRDYSAERASVSALAIGKPASVFKVQSPGGFPPGVEQDRLIASPSRPRNRALAHALRVLGLAEAEGVGIDTMFRLMLRDGHPNPSISEYGGDVIAILRGGASHRVVRQFFDDLTVRAPETEHDVRAIIAVTELLKTPVLRPDALSDIAQCTVGEAQALLETLLGAAVVVRLRNGARSYRLSELARKALAPRISYQRRRQLDDQWDEIQALLDAAPEISRLDVEGLLSLRQPRAAQVIRTLVADGRLAPVGGRERGRGVRYRRGSPTR